MMPRTRSSGSSAATSRAKGSTACTGSPSLLAFAAGVDQQVNRIGRSGPASRAWRARSRAWRSEPSDWTACA